ncbi:MAG TPA: DUF1326 domain-containing protein [Nitrososphaera sp.]|nr:DUF1326 domain-containing protein [Nitrososphaera sp.]
MPAIQIHKWNLNMDYVETCNCDYGCPCNFSGFPTDGFCRAIVLYHIKSGSFGNVRLDEIDVIYVGSWPKAIHEGNGTMQLFIGKQTTEDQRKAIVQIFSGKAKGESPFALFANTLKYILEPQYVNISTKIDGKKSSFSVPGIIDVKIESFKNPVTGEEQDTKIQIPKGFIFKLADAAKTKVMRILTPSLNFDDSGQNAFVTALEFKGP